MFQVNFGLRFYPPEVFRLSPEWHKPVPWTVLDAYVCKNNIKIQIKFIVTRERERERERCMYRIFQWLDNLSGRRGPFERKWTLPSAKRKAWQTIIWFHIDKPIGISKESILTDSKISTVKEPIISNLSSISWQWQALLFRPREKERIKKTHRLCKSLSLLFSEQKKKGGLSLLFNESIVMWHVSSCSSAGAGVVANQGN